VREEEDLKVEIVISNISQKLFKSSSKIAFCKYFSLFNKFNILILISLFFHFLFAFIASEKKIFSSWLEVNIIKNIIVNMKTKYLLLLHSKLFCEPCSLQLVFIYKSDFHTAYTYSSSLPQFTLVVFRMHFLLYCKTFYVLLLFCLVLGFLHPSLMALMQWLFYKHRDEKNSCKNGK
jgi:hypothetical protein